MTRIKKLFIVLLLSSLLASPVLADFGYDDSPEFSLNLLNLPADGAYGHNDSETFSLNLYPVNRGWADSGEFSFDSGGQSQPMDMEGTVRDIDTGRPIVGAVVTLSGENPVQSNSDGKFTYDSPSGGQKVLTITQSGYYSVTQEITLTEGSGQILNIVMTPETPGTDPAVISIQSQYCGPGKHVYYLNGVSLNQTFTAKVDWKSHTPGTVYFNGTPVSPNGNKATYTVNVGSDLSIGSQLEIYAQAANDTTSIARKANFDVISPPPGIPTGLLVPELGGNELSYSAEWLLDAIKEGVGEDTIDEEVPGFGGRAFEFGIMPYLSAKIMGSGSVTASIMDGYDLPEFDLAGVGFKPSATVELGWNYQPDNQVWLPTGALGIKVDGSYQSPPSYYVIAVGPVPVPVYWRCALETALEVNLALNGWNPDYSPIWSGSIPFDIYVEIMLGVGAADVLAVEGYLGGGANMLLEFPDNDPLKQLTIYLDGGLRIVVWIWDYEKPLLHYEWDLYGNNKSNMQSMSLTGGLPDASEFEPMERGYLDDNYATWQVSRVKTKMGTMMVQAADATIEMNSETVLQTNVFPRSTPAITSGNGQEMVLTWIYDDQSRGDLDRTKVVFSKKDATGWSSPVAVADDGTADFSPQLANLSNGDVIAVWENANQIMPVDADLTEFASTLEVAVGYYDTVSGSWTAQDLTVDGHLDRSPRIAVGTDDTAMVVWIQNENDHIIGNNSDYNDIQYSLWDGANWTTPITVTSNVGSILKATLDYDGSSAVYVYTVDVDGDLQTEQDHELYSLIWDSTDGWSEPVQLTNDTIVDANPQVKLTPTGQTLLVWYQDPNIVWSDDLTLANTQSIMQTSQSSGASDFKLARSSSGQISLVWTDNSPKGVDIWTATYDANLSVWSKPYQLTDDRQMEHSLSPVFNGNNDLILTYNKVHIIDNNGVPGAGEVDLCVLEHAIEGDLAIEAGGIYLSEVNPLVGSLVDVYAKIVNQGSIAAQNVDIEFYQGNPQSGGTLIGSTILTGPIAAADSAIASVQWQVPEASYLLDIYVVVDPNVNIEDVNRDNNVAHSTVLLPELVVREMYSQKAGYKKRTITARIANEGAVPASGVSVSLRLDSPNGVPLASFNMSQLEVGSYQDVNFLWDFSQLDIDTWSAPVYAVVDMNDNIREYNEENNTLSAQVQVTKLADITDSRKVDLEDLLALSTEWLQTGSLTADISPLGGDGTVNMQDLAEIANHWLEGIGD